MMASDKKEEGFYQTLFDHAGDAIFVHDLKGKFLNVNQVACERLGYSKEELLQLRHQDIDSPEWRDLVPKRMEKLLRTGGIVVEAAHVRRNGTVIPIELSCRLIQYRNEPAILSIARDITKRKQTQKELENYRQDLEALVKERTAELTRANKLLNHSYQIQTIINSVMQVSLEHISFEKQLERILEITFSIPWLKIKSHGFILLVEENGSEKLIIRKQDRFYQKKRLICQRNILNKCLCELAMETHEIQIKNNQDSCYGMDFQSSEFYSQYAIPIIFKDKVFGVMNLQFDAEHKRNKETEKPLSAIASTLAVIIEHERSKEKLLSHQEQLRSLSSELITTKDKERKWIAAHLHDNISQNLALSHIKLETLMEKASSDDISSMLKEIKELLEEADQFTRSLMSELSPQVPSKGGFEKELEWLTEQIYKKHGITSYFEDDKQPKPLEDEVRIFLFQAVRELLINIVKHAQAHNTKVSVRKNGKMVQVRVEDNGIGFNKSEVLNNDRFGLYNIRKRLGHLGGRLEIVSEPGRETAVTLFMPLGKQKDQK